VNRRIIISASILLALQSGSVLADSTFRAAAGLSYGETDYKDTQKNKNTDLSFEFYFTPVEKKSHPWREAAFLEHTSSLSLELGKETATPTDTGQSYDGSSFALGGDYASKSNPLIVSAIYSASERSANLPTYKYKSEARAKGIGIGAYLSQPLAILAYFSTAKYKTTYDNFPQFNSDDSSNLYGILTKYVYEMPQQQALNLELGISFFNYKPEGSSTEKNNSVDFSTTYYFNPKIGITGELSLQSGDSDFFKGTQYGLGVNAFVTENLSLAAKYSLFNSDSSDGVDNNEWNISLAWLF